MEVGAILGVVILAIAFGFFSYFHKLALPYIVILQVPFTSQAPNGNWDRNEDCEETSIVMATAFLNNQTGNTMSVSDAQKAINQLKAWENINQGYNENTGADAIKKMAEGAFGLNV